MKINGTGNVNYMSGNYRASKIGAYKQSAGVLKSDEATLSEEAVSFSKVFSELKEAMNTRSAEDLKRIADIKEQIQAGTYRVDSGDIADSILGELYG